MGKCVSQCLWCLFYLLPVIFLPFLIKLSCSHIVGQYTFPHGTHTSDSGPLTTHFNSHLQVRNLNSSVNQSDKINVDLYYEVTSANWYHVWPLLLLLLGSVSWQQGLCPVSAVPSLGVHEGHLQGQLHPLREGLREFYFMLYREKEAGSHLLLWPVSLWPFVCFEKCGGIFC